VKRPHHQIQCSIAGTTVTVSLRKGGGFREPAVQYVRCDDRDCQHVDLNEPPCPLRRDMFGHGDAERVGALLATTAGEPMCYPCISDALALSHHEVRRAAWRLTEAGAVTVHPRTCPTCRQRRVCLTPVGGAIAGVAADQDTSVNAPHVDAHEPIRAFLAKSPGSAYCAACVALSARLALAEVRDVVRDLNIRGLRRDENACSGCGRWQTVIRDDR
jgi:hypothetical protein